MNTAIKKILTTGLVLLVISSFVAGMLAVINEFTAPTIEKNKLNEKRAAVSELFGNDISVKTEKRNLNKNVSEVLGIYSSDNTIKGFCVFATAQGFKDNIDLAIGVDENGVIKGIIVLDMSETPGIGAKISDSKYLSSYIDKDYTVSFENGIDAISGATISSSALLNAVKAAISPEILFGEGVNQ